MKVLVFGGAGKIGSAVARDLAGDEEIESIGIVARNDRSLEKTLSWIASDKVTTHALDIADAAVTRRLMKKYNVAVIAMPDRRASYRTVKAAIDAGINAVDVLERVTGSTAAIGAWLVGKGEIHKRGIIAPEDGIAGDVLQKFLDNLKSRSIVVKEVVSSI